MMNIDITGYLSHWPEEATQNQIFLCASVINTGGIQTSTTKVWGDTNSSQNINTQISLTVDYGEPTMGTEKPALYVIYYIDDRTWGSIPVTFVESRTIKFFVDGVQYTALSGMTWSQFVKNSTYNKSKKDAYGVIYKQFSTKNDTVYYAILYDDEYDMDYQLYILNDDGLTGTEISLTDTIVENGNYIY